MLHAEENVETKDNREYTVGAVYKDFPGNTQMRNLIYTAIGSTFQRDNFGASNFACYVLLDKAESAQDVVDNFNANFDFTKIGKKDQQLKLTPLTAIYYLNESQDGMIFRSGNNEVTFVVIFYRLIDHYRSCYQFYQLQYGLTPLRIKSINTQKVLGSSDRLLRNALLAEAAIVSLIAWLISLVLV